MLFQPNGPLTTKNPKDFKDFKDFKVFRDFKDFKDLKDLKGYRVFEDLKDPKVLGNRSANMHFCSLSGTGKNHYIYAGSLHPHMAHTFGNQSPCQVIHSKTYIFMHIDTQTVNRHPGISGTLVGYAVNTARGLG